MRPAEKKTTTESIELYKQSLKGNNYSLQSIKAYLGDIGQFVEWLKARRVDFDIPHRIERIDIVKFINHLAEQKASAVTRKRKLAAIRGFLKFSKTTRLSLAIQPTPLKDRSGKSGTRRYSSRRSIRLCCTKQGGTRGIWRL